MGFLSSLGSILKIAGPLAAIPFTGGASAGLLGAAGGASALSKVLPSVLGAAGDIGSVLGKQEAGKSAGKIQQADLNQRQDSNALANYIAQQNAQNTAANTDLQRKQFESTNRSSTAKQALIGALLGGGITPTSISGGKASGGLLASLNGNPEALAAMKLLGQQGSTAQQTPLQFQGGQMIAPPKLTPLQQIDNGGLLSTLARIGEIAGVAGKHLPQGQSRPPVQYGPEAIAGLPFMVPGQDMGIPQPPDEPATGLADNAQRLLRNVRL